jgi:hypothetical protein
MTCRSHLRAYPALNGHPSHDDSPSLQPLLSEWSEHSFPGKPFPAFRANVRSGIARTMGRTARHIKSSHSRAVRSVNRLPTLTPHLEDQSTTYDADRRSDPTPNNSRFSHMTRG